jgi:hypothetical protein
MKALSFLLVISLSFFGCKEDIAVPSSCTFSATVKDMTGLDGCGYVFVLDDGKIIEPYRTMFCGTPPFSKEITDDPLYNFQFVDGKKVMLSYETVENAFGICMAGQVAKITCLSESEVSVAEK